LQNCAAPELRSKQDILLKVHRASICGSDLAIYGWSSWAPRKVHPPLIFGHEVCGEIVESKTPSLPVGTRVACESHVWCGHCAACKARDFHLCHNMKLLGVDINGGFAEFLVMPAKGVRKLESKKLFDFGSLLEPLGNAVYATGVESVAGKKVLVLGCGPQGLFAIQVAKAMGARFIVAVEQSGFRAKLAKAMGAHHVVSAIAIGQLKEHLLSYRETSEGFDVVLEMSGSRDLIPVALQVLRNGGRLSLFGLPSRSVNLDIAHDVIFKGARIYGILGRRIWKTWDTMLELVDSGKIRLGPIVTHRFKLQDYEKAFDLMQSKEKNCGKILFEIGG